MCIFIVVLSDKLEKNITLSELFFHELCLEGFLKSIKDY